MLQAQILTGLLVAVLAGCAGERDYDRHRMSRIGTTASDPGAWLYEAQIDPKYPAESAAAEAMRMEWLDDWMERGQYCADGYEVVERREFAADEPNPYGSDLRYLVKCADEPDD
ncbi:hypothetical protein BH24PSE2_BH24PSE2_02360 [soil metagenome]